MIILLALILLTLLFPGLMRFGCLTVLILFVWAIAHGVPN